MLLGYSFEPSPYRRVLDTAGSAITIGDQLTDARTGINLFDERKQDGVVQRFGLQRPQTLDAIHAEPSFLLFIQEDKKRLCSQDEFDCD